MVSKAPLRKSFLSVWASCLRRWLQAPPQQSFLALLAAAQTYMLSAWPCDVHTFSPSCYNLTFTLSYIAALPTAPRDFPRSSLWVTEIYFYILFACDLPFCGSKSSSLLCTLPAGPCCTALSWPGALLRKIAREDKHEVLWAEVSLPEWLRGWT